VTSITTVAGVASTALMPRIFYSDPETTVRWKARWHVSVLAPTLTNVSPTLLHEYALKDAIRSHRPDCNDTNQGARRRAVERGAAVRAGRCGSEGGIVSDGSITPTIHSARLGI
jgi:hypothetical protein